MEVKSAVIDWQTNILTIKKLTGESVYIPLSEQITVKMIDWSDKQVEKTMLARELGEYMRTGSIIIEIEENKKDTWEEAKQKAKEFNAQLPERLVSIAEEQERKSVLDAVEI